MPRLLKIAITSAVASSFFALPFALLAGYEIYQASQARKAYDQCASLTLPMNLKDFRVKFGAPVGLYVGQDEVHHYFEPTTGYYDFASGSINAVTAPRSDKVIKFFCGS